jgi:hypothetical protein
MKNKRNTLLDINKLNKFAGRSHVFWYGEGWEDFINSYHEGMDKITNLKLLVVEELKCR